MPRIAKPKSLRTVARGSARKPRKNWNNGGKRAQRENAQGFLQSEQEDGTLGPQPRRVGKKPKGGTAAYAESEGISIPRSYKTSESQRRHHALYHGSRILGRYATWWEGAQAWEKYLATISLDTVQSMVVEEILRKARGTKPRPELSYIIGPFSITLTPAYGRLAKPPSAHTPASLATPSNIKEL